MGWVHSGFPNSSQLVDPLIMKFVNNKLSLGLLVGALVGVGGTGLYAHAGHMQGHAMHEHGRHSVAGSPDELAQRARELGEHVCATIKATLDCPVTPISEVAAKELDAMSASFQQGQEQLHDSLTAADFDRAGFARIQAGQAKAIGASATRYMQFLGDAAAALTPEQRQMFSRKGHAEQ